MQIFCRFSAILQTGSRMGDFETQTSEVNKVKLLVLM
jgi:hypothetical protein